VPDLSSTSSTERPLLDIQDLEVAFPARDGGWVPVVRGASLSVRRGEAVGLVGESGSGKTLTALSVLRLVPPPGRLAGRVLLDGPGGGDLLALPERAMRRVRGGRIGFVFQEPMAALDPVYTIGFQIAEAVRSQRGHRTMSRRAAREEVVRLLDRVALPAARRRLDDYPHQLSGGQRQRVGIAMALAGGPDLLLADEPTTALDVTLQAQVLDLLARLRAELGLAVLLITHDLGIVAETCDRAVVMHRGEVVESADTAALFRAPSHPSTRALLAALATPPAAGAPPSAPAGPPLAEVVGLCREFAVRRGLLQRTRGVVRAVDGVDLALRRGECLALVGESGSGKTTLGRCLIRLLEPTAGRVLFDGEDLLALRSRALRARRRRFQIVFQDPWGSLDPRQRVEAIVAEPLALHTRLRPAERRRQTAELLASVGLEPALAGRFPHELSGGQRQRVGIARALAAGPELLVADEAVSALDVSVRGQVLDLLAGLRERLGLALLFISHDLAAVQRVADRVAVMYLGRVVEEAPRAALFHRPLHPYTVSLLAAVPVPVVPGTLGAPGAPGRRARAALRGEPPSPLAPPPGCPFHPRCPAARERCAAETPLLAEVEPGRRVACFYPGEYPGENRGEDSGEPPVDPAVDPVNLWGVRA
jgi:peptide/nickel transport system ATP-binding protein